MGASDCGVYNGNAPLPADQYLAPNAFPLPPILVNALNISPIHVVSSILLSVVGVNNSTGCNGIVSNTSYCSVVKASDL